MRKIALLFFIYLNGQWIYAQHSIHLIEIDFEKCQTSINGCGTNFKLPEEVNIGDYYQVRIHNINLNQFKVSINGKEDTTKTPSISTPTYSSFSIDPIIALTDGLSTTVTGKDLLSQLNALQELGGVRSMEAMSTIPVFGEDPGVDDRNEEKQVVDELNLIVHTLNILNNDFTNLIHIKLSNDLERARSFTNLLSNENLYASLVLEDQIFEHADKIQKGLADLDKRFYEILLDYNTLVENKGGIIKNDAEIKTFSDDVNKQLKATKESLDESKQSISIKAILDEAIQATMISQNRSAIYTSLPNLINSKETIVTISIDPREPTYLKNKYESVFVMKKETRNYFGTGISYYYSYLSDENYSVLETISESDTTYAIVDEGLNKGEIGLASFLRIGKIHKDDERFGFHGVLGAGASITETVRPRLMVGGGISFGNTPHSIALDLGLIVGHSERLSNAANTTVNYSIKPERLTVSELDFKLFISLGYVLRLN